MLKKSVLIMLMSIIPMIFTSTVVFAQDDAVPIETTQLPIGEEQDPNRPVEESGDEDVNENNEDSTQSFLNGVLAGGAIFLVVGFALGWFIKNKSYKD